MKLLFWIGFALQLVLLAGSIAVLRHAARRRRDDEAAAAGDSSTLGPRMRLGVGCDAEHFCRLRHGLALRRGMTYAPL